VIDDSSAPASRSEDADGRELARQLRRCAIRVEETTNELLELPRSHASVSELRDVARTLRTLSEAMLAPRRGRSIAPSS